ncbi:hypothetical protein CIG2463D_0912 [Campylobacter iguaniorum]|uniref:Transformation system protein n=1 Tax=Campylobacter iguaniorum TaxID=1244531 RepID=A0A076F947_9BACT|nr:hypothetical protein [Campylobacter iguaniorum]AII14750.1 hypothetical protein CIG1485E_0912 [Campylobacter iguaniorum]ALV24485.1 hypothetical protein CIG2463D_0912 [Campylobacter iguaniorum]
MKKFTLIALCCIFMSGNDEIIKQYTNFIQDINEKRTGLTEIEIQSLSNPFIIKPQTAVSSNIVDINETQDPYRLYAIFDNKVKINSLWLKKGDLIGPYTVEKIKQSSVILKNQTQNLELNLTKGDKNVNISYK